MLVKRLINKQRIILGKPLGSGGEGTIYEVEKQPSVVAKLYHPEKLTQAHGDKLMAMLANPPQERGKSHNLRAIAWPMDLLIPPNGSRKILGFLMPRVRNARPLHQFYTPKQRREHSPFFNYLYMLQTGRNLAMAVKAIHSKGYVIGDLNESNILVTETTLVTLVDADSFQVYDRKKGYVYRCPVGKVESTPPELQGANFRNVDRSQEQDLFGLAVLIFQLLMEGNHPFDGVFKGKGEPPGKRERIKEGHFPYGSKKVPYTPKPIAPPFTVLNPRLQELFHRCFEEGHHNPQARPVAAQWAKALEEARQTLIRCSENQQHRYGKHLNRCPWCKRRNLLGGADPFPSVEAVKRGEHIPAKPKKTAPVITSTSTSISKPKKKVILIWPLWKSINGLLWGLLLISCLFLAYPLLWLTISSFPTESFSNSNSLSLKTLNIGAKSKDVVTISPDGKIVARATEKGKIEIWDLSSGEQIYNLQPKNFSIEVMAISGDNHLLIIGGIDGELQIFNLQNGQWEQEIRGHKTAVKSLAIAPNQKTFVSGATDGTIAIWDLGQQSGIMGRVHKSSVLSLAISGDSQTLVSGSSDYQIKVWNLLDGSLKHQFETEGSWVNAVDISHNGEIVNRVSSNGAIAVWNLNELNENEPKYMLERHQNGVRSLAISSDGNTLVSGGEDGRIITWNLNTGTAQHILGDGNLPVNLVTITPEDNKIISRSGSKKIIIWPMP